MNENMLEVKNLTKKFDGFVLDNVNFSLPKGAIMGLIGENGAGKTTLIKLIMNMYGRESGEIKGVGGLDNVSDEPAFKERVGYVADEDYLYYNSKMCDIAAAFSVAFERWDESIFQNYVDLWKLPLDKKAGEMSKGTKTKMMLALALAHKPELLILDEPTAGLDPAARIEVLDILRDFVSDGEHSVLFSTHLTSDLDKVADYITLIIDGKIIESMTIDEIEEKYAIASGENTPSDKIKPYLIGCRQNSTRFTALVRRSDIPKL